MIMAFSKSIVMAWKDHGISCGVCNHVRGSQHKN